VFGKGGYLNEEAKPDKDHHIGHIVYTDTYCVDSYPEFAGDVSI
jgi:hypothetical protein